MFWELLDFLQSQSRDHFKRHLMHLIVLLDPCNWRNMSCWFPPVCLALRAPSRQKMGEQTLDRVGIGSVCSWSVSVLNLPNGLTHLNNPSGPHVPHPLEMTLMFSEVPYDTSNLCYYCIILSCCR